MEEKKKRFQHMDEQSLALKDWFTVFSGGFQVRRGKSVVRTITGALKHALNMFDIKPEHLKLRQKIKDVKGEIGPKGRHYEVNILLKNDDCYIFEIKSTPDKEYILRFNDKAELAKRILKRNEAKKVLLTLAKEPYIKNLTRHLKIILV